MISKPNLRKVLLTRLKEMPPAERFEKSMSAWRALYATALWQNADAVLAYSPMVDELDSESMLLYALKLGKTLFLPRVVGKNVVFLHTPSLDNLEPYSAGFLQPLKDAEPFSPSQFKNPLIIAPCLAANRSGYRLGRGLGYYDRFLGSFMQHCHQAKSLVVTYSDNLTDDFVQESHDQPFNYILSDKGLQAAL